MNTYESYEDLKAEVKRLRAELVEAKNASESWRETARQFEELLSDRKPRSETPDYIDYDKIGRRANSLTEYALGKHWSWDHDKLWAKIKNALLSVACAEPPNPVLPPREVLEAARRADWGQVAMNGGPPCFHLDGSRFCFRVERWAGHNGQHKFLPIEAAIAAWSTAIKDEIKKHIEARIMVAADAAIIACKGRYDPASRVHAAKAIREALIGDTEGGE